MKRFFGRIEIRNECLHLTVKVEMYAYIFIYILSNGCMPITIPKHEPIKKVYVEMVRQIVESEAKNDEDAE